MPPAGSPGTLLSGLLYLWGGLPPALWGSTTFVITPWLIARRLPPMPHDVDISLATVETGDRSNVSLMFWP